MASLKDLNSCSTYTILQLLENGDSWAQLLERVQGQYSVSTQRVYELTNVCLSGGDIFAERRLEGSVLYYHRGHH